MGIERESEIIGIFLSNKEIDPKSVGLEKKIFKNQNSRLICNLILSGIRDGTEIYEQLKTKSQTIASYIASCIDNLHRFGASEERVRELITAQKKELLNEKIIKLINDGARRGDYDYNKIKELYDQVDYLSSSNNQLEFLKLSDVEPAALSWLWFNRFPLGSYAAVCGDPGDGKSISMTHIGSRITKGEPLPDKQLDNPKGSVLYFVAEDGLRDTVRVRAEDAGADLTKFEVHTGEKKDGSFFSLVNPNDRKSLEEKIKRLKDVKLIIFDPISTFMAGLRTNDENEVRAS